MRTMFSISLVTFALASSIKGIWVATASMLRRGIGWDECECDAGRVVELYASWCVWLSSPATEGSWGEGSEVVVSVVMLLPEVEVEGFGPSSNATKYTGLG